MSSLNRSLEKKQGQNPLLFWSICLASSTPQAFVLLRYKILLNKYLPSCGFLANKDPFAACKIPKLLSLNLLICIPPTGPLFICTTLEDSYSSCQDKLASLYNNYTKQTKSCSASKMLSSLQKLDMLIKMTIIFIELSWTWAMGSALSSSSTKLKTCTRHAKIYIMIFASLSSFTSCEDKNIAAVVVPRSIYCDDSFFPLSNEAAWTKAKKRAPI